MVNNLKHMKLKDYAKHISDMAKKYPNAEVVYASDDEGNFFAPVNYGPSIGTFSDGQFSALEPDGKVDAICIN